MIEKSVFGSFKGNNIYKYTMTNKHGMKVSCISHGAALTEIVVPDKLGNFSNVLLGFDNLDSYIKDRKMFLGAAIGRVAGRITNGSFKIKGISYNVPKNEGKNTLHGGTYGFNSLIWNSSTEDSEEATSVLFQRTISPDEDGFPGTLNVEVKYTLNNNNDLLITFSGLSNKDTLFNPTVHSYFNLNNDITKLFSGHTLQISASRYAEINEALLPTGTLKEVSGTPFDFQQPKNLEDAIKYLQTESGLNGFDHPFNVNGKNIATLINHDTCRRLDIESDRNALIVYTLNIKDDTWKVQNQKLVSNMGIALEPQTLPDAIHYKNFGDIILPANKRKCYNIKYHFSLI
ncbi:aldose epimerase family protein [Clostridium coskatii]|uniref:Aldose 1-epimerase n=1 Tax=Clostridium coskatii TaxID=1705578 RepID=A0A162L6J0_9CLOT|nr:aldose epimerase family protein [Clostridium coskatii]OAA85078.1 Maltose epimerase [Clostridium coskatii]OBR97748.1 maltose epimerase [Clostridium coskatii]